MRRIIPILRVWWNFHKPIPHNEFDLSLDMDADYVSDILDQINYWKRKYADYSRTLCRRRDAAHIADMKRSEQE